MCCGQKRLAMKGSSNSARPLGAPSRSGVQSVSANPLSQLSGQRGPQTTFSSLPGQIARAPIVLAVSSFRPRMNIRYLGSSPIRLKGSVSGRYYQFSVARPLQPLDSRDAASLLKSHLFHRA